MKTTIHLRFLMSLLMLSAPIYTFASDVIVRGVNLGECTSYSDGCNTCTHSENGDACTMMACVWVGTPKCLDATGSNLEDTQIIDAVAAKNTKISFGVKTYNTCTDVNKAIKDFIISYYSRANFQPY
jgi:hypothetical protein